MKTPLALCLTLALATPAPLRAQEDDFFAHRPAFSRGDQPAREYARCEDVRVQAEGVDDPGFRVDLSVVGKLTLVKTDGVLWYLVVCSDLRVMCVAYQRNDMKVGDRVTVKGGYRRLDPNHAVLDPCLANDEPE